MRVLLISNSHVAAVYRAMNSGSFKSDIEIELLSAAGTDLSKNITIDGTIIKLDPSAIQANLRVPTAISSSGYLDLTIYDRVIFYGLQLLSRGDGKNWIAVVRESQQPYSRAVWKSLAADYARDTEHYRLVSSIRDEEIRRRTLSLPCPLPNIAHPEFRTLRNPSSERLKELHRAVEEETNSVGVRYVPLPEELLDGGGYATDAGFKNLRANDYAHLNEHGGRLVLDRICSVLAGHAIAA
jgi:hypothetical protein